MKDIRGSHAIVTGASRGIGPYIAKTLAAQGVSLALAARDAARLEDTRGACEALGVRAIAVPTDVTSREDLRKLVEKAERELGPIDILVNNAGIEITKSLQDTSFDEIDAVVRTNLSAPVWLIKMVAADGGAPARRDRQRLVTGREVLRAIRRHLCSDQGRPHWSQPVRRPRARWFGRDHRHRMSGFRQRSRYVGEYGREGAADAP